MVQISYGITSGPNGMQMTPIFTPSPSAPTPPKSYESHFETPEGVHVQVTYHTSDKEVSDKLAAQLSQLTEWKDYVAPPSAPESLASKIATAWLVAFMLPFITFFASMFLGMLLDVTDILGPWSYRDAENLVKETAMYGLWSFPILGFLISAVAIFTHSSDNSNG